MACAFTAGLLWQGLRQRCDELHRLANAVNTVTMHTELPGVCHVRLPSEAVLHAGPALALAHRRKAARVQTLRKWCSTACIDVASAFIRGRWREMEMER